jgi:hypothetical protein
MELSAHRIVKLETACAELLELIKKVPNSPLPLRAFVGTAAKWENAHADRNNRSQAKAAQG